MLLSLMRKHAKSWLIKFFIGIISAVFIFYFGYSFRAERGVKVAYVNGDVITGQEYNKAYYALREELRMKYKEVWNDNLIDVFGLRRSALDTLINEKLISQEAGKLGMEVTEEEIQKAIMGYPAFQINGQFDEGRYLAVLNHERLKPEDFEADMSRGLLGEKLKQFLTTFTEATDQEVLDHYTYANEKVKISFVQFKPDRFEKMIKTDQASMEAFFEEHKEEYRVPEKINISYLAIDPEELQEKVKIDDREINSYYEYHLDSYLEPKQVRARHILFKLSQQATEKEEEKVRNKAEAILEEARQGKDFGGLARKHSEGPTRSEGGDLGYFSAGQMEKPFEDAAFNLKKGEISGLVRTRFGYHIIKAEDVKEAGPKLLEQVRDQIVKTLVTNTATELAYEKGLSLIDQMPYDVNLDLYAAEQELEIESSGYFSQGESIPGIGGNEKLRQSLFSLEEAETSELIELQGKFYIFQVTDRKASYLPEMEEVADKVNVEFASHLAAKEAKVTAESYLRELHGGKAWDELAKEMGLEPEETDFFSRRDPIPKIGYEPDIVETAFRLKEDNKFPDSVFENDEGAFVIRWEANKGIDEKRYQEEKERHRFSLMQAKQMRTFENWLENLKRNAKIEILEPLT
ncbi:MAG: SurA N-terminal domain-containing protein [Thermodesulfobacteriota bacterium]|nr:SurA N-terminal domain-containing protein [Thermodesulfobacteriota bacterium]